MIKKILVAAFVLMSISGYSQDFPVDKDTGKITYTGVVEAKGTKDELYGKAKEWVVDNFKSIGHVLQVDDLGSGLMVGKSNTTLYGVKTAKGLVLDQKLFFTFKINFKDGKYKYEFTDLQLEFSKGSNLPVEDFFLVPVNPEKPLTDAGKTMEKYKVDTQEIFASLEESLKKKLAEEAW